MHNWTRWGVALMGSAALAAGDALAQNATGDWHGTVAIPVPGGPVIPIVVTLKAKAGGDYEGSYVMLREGQGNAKAAIMDEAKVDKGTLNFSHGGSSFSGRWDEARKAWVGQWVFQVTRAVPDPSNAPVPVLSSPLVLTAGKS
jgi:uncharacterized protein